MFKRNNLSLVAKNFMIVLLLLTLVLTLGCSSKSTNSNIENNKSTVDDKATKPLQGDLTLATTTSTQDSGLLEVLIPAFEKKYGIKVKVIAVGSGAAMEMGKKGDADVLLVHSKKDEEKFMAEGYGDSRKPVMHNEFFLVGPVNDPAGIKTIPNILDALKKISTSKAPFISRDDKSGTHKKELALWEKAEIKPTGKWYFKSGQGMGETLNMANEEKAYTLTDGATYLAQKDKLNLIITVRGDKNLLNPYSVITVSKKKFPKINHTAALHFSNFVTSSEGQNVIAAFGKAKYGEPLFYSDVVSVAK